MVPADPARIRQRRRDGHPSQLGHQPGEHPPVTRGHVRRVPWQQLAAGPELLRVHSQRTDTRHWRERPRTRKAAPGQPGLRRDTRHRPAVIGTRLDYHVPAISQPQTEHQRYLLQPEQHANGFTPQMFQAPGRQPVRQILQRHSQDYATNAKHADA